MMIQFTALLTLTLISSSKSYNLLYTATNKGYNKPLSKTPTISNRLHSKYTFKHNTYGMNKYNTYNAFTTHTATTTTTTTTLKSSREQEEIPTLITSSQSTLTPPGFGFDASARRIVEGQPGGDLGFVNCYTDELITDVVGRMYTPSGAISGVALVYNRNEQFRGVFTEKDYVVWSGSRDEKGENLEGVIEGSLGEKGTVGEWCTDAEKVSLTHGGNKGRGGGGGRYHFWEGRVGGKRWDTRNTLRETRGGHREKERPRK